MITRLVAALGTALAAWLVAAGAAAAYPTLPGTIWTIAGDGTMCVVPAGTCGDGPNATAAQLAAPTGVAVDGHGNVYIADQNNSKIRKLTPAGAISTIAGDGNYCQARTGTCGDGPIATAAQLSLPTGVAVDGDGNVYIADLDTNKIRKVTPAGAISTIAGNGIRFAVETSSCGDGPVATAAQLSDPTGVAVDGAGNVVHRRHRQSQDPKGDAERVDLHDRRRREPVRDRELRRRRRTAWPRNSEVRDSSSRGWGWPWTVTAMSTSLTGTASRSAS